MSARLLDLFHIQVSHATRTADEAASTSATRTLWAGLAVLLVTAATFGLAVILARRLVKRLQTLRSRSLELVHRTLPSMIERIQNGKPVDLDAEIGLVRPGTDEIDQVAEAFDIAQPHCGVRRGGAGTNPVWIRQGVPRYRLPKPGCGPQAVGGARSRGITAERPRTSATPVRSRPPDHTRPTQCREIC
ncbi:hypothetical protein C5E45_19550 [Nocardia nova]|uniref:HAMP domain-containing protein n=1 Tax=Nocardia nova TaxID=37330 RepID=A0A2S6AN10_9NOCA|nr:hypothetical protein C5E41_18980 [Nocardia nova]PPJ36610.1 hypothetical protein C5E45_19550 [Nocardia nova]